MGKLIKLTREMMLNIDDARTENVDVPEWGGFVTVKAMTGTERDRFESSLLSENGSAKPNMTNIRAKLVASTVIDTDTGKLMFTAGDIEQLGLKSASALDRIFTVAQRLSKISDKDVDEMIKN